MRRAITDRQTAFFTKNGFIEFELPHPNPPESDGRDQWRKDEELKIFILKTLGPLCLELTGKKQLRLALSEWITEENRPKKAALLKERISLQNLAIAISIAKEPIIPPKRSPLGILPIPATKEQLLFFRPTLILDWPHVTSPCFFIVFSFSNGVYIHNPQDPQTTYLKEFGYEYGDTLKAETHPLIFSNH